MKHDVLLCITMSIAINPTQSYLFFGLMYTPSCKQWPWMRRGQWGCPVQDNWNYRSMFRTTTQFLSNLGYPEIVVVHLGHSAHLSLARDRVAIFVLQ